MKIKILITKDALLRASLRVYNPKSHFNTPNISKVAENGTVLLNHYTTAPSTAMAITSIITSKFPYQFGRNRYTKVKVANDPKIFSTSMNNGYKPILIVPNNWKSLIELINAFEGVKIIYYNRTNINIMKVIIELIHKNVDTDDFFLWIHLPHVIKPRTQYNSDIDLFDKFIGLLTAEFTEADLYISADHGHMNLNKKIMTYGFDLYQPAINVPFITNKKISTTNLSSHIDLVKIIFNDHIPTREFIISETAYRLQAHRKIAIINSNYKLIFNKLNKKFSLFDYLFDENENRDLLVLRKFDFMRGKFYILQGINFYPNMESALENYAVLKSEFDKIYKSENYAFEIFLKIEFYTKKIVLLILNFMKK